jgi:hypothetical protein
MTAFEYLIRFKSDSGEILYGEAGKPTRAEGFVRSTTNVYSPHNAVGSGATSCCQDRKGRKSM